MGGVQEPGPHALLLRNIPRTCSKLELLDAAAVFGGAVVHLPPPTAQPDRPVALLDFPTPMAAAEASIAWNGGARHPALGSCSVAADPSGRTMRVVAPRYFSREADFDELPTDSMDGSGASGKRAVSAQPGHEATAKVAPSMQAYPGDAAGMSSPRSGTAALKASFGRESLGKERNSSVRGRFRGRVGESRWALRSDRYTAASKTMSTVPRGHDRLSRLSEYGELRDESQFEVLGRKGSSGCGNFVDNPTRDLPWRAEEPQEKRPRVSDAGSTDYRCRGEIGVDKGAGGHSRRRDSAQGKTEFYRAGCSLAGMNDSGNREDLDRPSKSSARERRENDRQGRYSRFPSEFSHRLHRQVEEDHGVGKQKDVGEEPDRDTWRRHGDESWQGRDSRVKVATAGGPEARPYYPKSAYDLRNDSPAAEVSRTVRREERRILGDARGSGLVPQRSVRLGYGRDGGRFWESEGHMRGLRDARRAVAKRTGDPNVSHGHGYRSPPPAPGDESDDSLVDWRPLLSDGEAFVFSQLLRSPIETSPRTSPSGAACSRDRGVASNEAKHQIEGEHQIEGSGMCRIDVAPLEPAANRASRATFVGSEHVVGRSTSPVVESQRYCRSAARHDADLPSDGQYAVTQGLYTERPAIRVCHVGFDGRRLQRGEIAFFFGGLRPCRRMRVDILEIGRNYDVCFEHASDRNAVFQFCSSHFATGASQTKSIAVSMCSRDVRLFEVGRIVSCPAPQSTRSYVDAAPSRGFREAHVGHLAREPNRKYPSCRESGTEGSTPAPSHSPPSPPAQSHGVRRNRVDNEEYLGVAVRSPGMHLPASRPFSASDSLGGIGSSDNEPLACVSRPSTNPGTKWEDGDAKDASHGSHLEHGSGSQSLSREVVRGGQQALAPGVPISSEPFRCRPLDSQGKPPLCLFSRDTDGDCTHAQCLATREFESFLHERVPDIGEGKDVRNFATEKKKRLVVESGCRMQEISADLSSQSPVAVGKSSCKARLQEGGKNQRTLSINEHLDGRECKAPIKEVNIPVSSSDGNVGVTLRSGLDEYLRDDSGLFPRKRRVPCDASVRHRLDTSLDVPRKKTREQPRQRVASNRRSEDPSPPIDDVDRGKSKTVSSASFLSGAGSDNLDTTGGSPFLTGEQLVVSEHVDSNLGDIRASHSADLSESEEESDVDIDEYVIRRSKKRRRLVLPMDNELGPVHEVRVNAAAVTLQTPELTRSSGVDEEELPKNANGALPPDLTRSSRVDEEELPNDAKESADGAKTGGKPSEVPVSEVKSIVSSYATAATQPECSRSKHTKSRSKRTHSEDDAARTVGCVSERPGISSSTTVGDGDHLFHGDQSSRNSPAALEVVVDDVLQKSASVEDSHEALDGEVRCARIVAKPKSKTSLKGVTCARTAGFVKEQWRKSEAAQVPEELERRLQAFIEQNVKNAEAVYKTARSNRQELRKLRQGLSQASLNTDSLAVSYLSARQKNLAFAKSRIHGMGLYACEDIAAGEFVIEYVGEVVRRSVSEVREREYIKQGMGDSYLFRLDGCLVVDATRKGSKARFINHSCAPNVIAKIISVNGVEKIVFYAKRAITVGEEITYDYKFAFEEEDEKITCYCGAPNCNKTLN